MLFESIRFLDNSISFWRLLDLSDWCIVEKFWIAVLLRSTASNVFIIVVFVFIYPPSSPLWSKWVSKLSSSSIRVRSLHFVSFESLAVTTHLPPLQWLRDQVTARLVFFPNSDLILIACNCIWKLSWIIKTWSARLSLRDLSTIQTNVNRKDWYLIPVSHYDENPGQLAAWQTRDYGEVMVWWVMNRYVKIIFVVCQQDGINE